MATPYPSKKTLAELKANILAPATTSHFQCWFNPPDKVREWINKYRVEAGLGDGYKTPNDAEFFSLSCSEASLPGSSLATHEINNDFTGVTERHVYRRQYDNSADFTFYVDHDYNIILFFENWMSYIVDEQFTNRENREPNEGIENEEFYYRVNYPGTTATNGYKTTLFLNKFEKDYAGRILRYRFLNAYPISIASMPVSYDSSQLLKCTVSFNYSRYLVSTEDIPVNKPIQDYYGPAYNDDEEADRQRRILNGEIVDTVYGQ